MANKSKSSESSTEAHLDYLQKSDVSQQICDGLLKLIENKPDQPMLFLANYFDSCTDKSGKVASALRLLKYTRNNPNIFEANLLEAYDILSVSKPPGTKKANNKPGLIGSVYEMFLKSILSNGLEEIKNNFLKLISCRNNEVVPFDVFRYGVHVCFLFNDYLNECKSLYHLIYNKQSNSSSDKNISEIVLSSYKSACSILLVKQDKSAQFLEAGFQLGPRNLALEMLNFRENPSNHSSLSEEGFLHEMTEILLKNTKILL